MNLYIDSEKNKLLIEQLKLDNEAAFRELYDITLPFIYYTVRNFSTDNRKAEDIVQEVYIDVWKQRSTLDENLSLIGLLKIITKRKLWRELSADKKRTELLYITPDQPYSQFDILVEEKENRQMLTRALDGLPERQRQVFKLIRSGLTAEEVAQKLRISKRTAENQLFRARKNLVKYLKKEKVIE